MYRFLMPLSWPEKYEAFVFPMTYLALSYFARYGCWTLLRHCQEPFKPTQVSVLHGTCSVPSSGCKESFSFSFLIIESSYHYFLFLLFKNNTARVRGICSVVQSSCCSCRGPGFGSQHPLLWLTVICHSSARGFNSLF